MIMSKIIQAISKLKAPAIIGISGFGGSDKSTLAKKLAFEIDAAIIGVDSFYKSHDIIEYQLWEIIDFNRLEREVLVPYTLGDNKISYSEFDWEKGQVLESKTISAHNHLIVEGVGLFRPQLIKYFKYTIWIDCPIEVAIARGKRRDREDYGIPADENWDGIWRNNDLQYFKRFLPKESADFILDY